MFRLLQIEFLKLKPYLPFWILAGLFALITIGGGLAVQSFINQAGDNAAQVSGAVLGQMELFDFNDLWQNLTWSGRFFFPLLAFLVVLSTHNELNYLTLRQHIIDGISHKEWLVSKVLVILVIAVFAGVVQILAGYIMGYSASPIDSFGDTLNGIVYVPVYMVQVVAFLSLALLITLLIKRSILSFILLLALYFPVEPMIRSIFPDSMNMITDLFPIKAITNVIHSPFAEYLNETAPGGISIREVSILIVQTISYWILSYFILVKRDL